MAVEIPYRDPAWERQPGETELWFRRFQTYSALGPERSLPKAMAADGVSAGNRRYWEEMCAENRWVERARAYDDQLNSRLLAEMEGARRDMLMRHATQARKSQEVIEQVVGRIGALCSDPQGGLNTLGLVPRTIKKVQEDGSVIQVRSEGLLPLMTSMMKAMREMQVAELASTGEPEHTTQVQITGPGGAPLGGVDSEQADAIFSRLESIVSQRFANGVPEMAAIELEAAEAEVASPEVADA